MFFYVLAIWTAATLALMPWLAGRLPESARSGFIILHVIELVACFLGLIAIWVTGWGGAVSDTVFAGVYAFLFVEAVAVYSVLRDRD